MQALASADAAPVAAFLAHLQLERNASPHTLAAYQRDLQALQQWAGQQDINDVLQLQAEDLRAFVAAGHRAGLSARSLQRRLSACRSFYAWHLRHGRIAASPVAGIRAPKAQRKLPQVLDADEAVQLVELPTNAPLGLRDRALLELFYSSGLRLSEVCALRWRDLDTAMALVQVQGKGRRDRLVPVGSHALNALAQWRADSGGADEAPIFPGRNGGPISQRAIQLRIKQLAQRQGLFKHVHPHMLRHGCGYALADQGADTRLIQDYLGHRNIQHTVRYTATNPARFERLWR